MHLDCSDFSSIVGCCSSPSHYPIRSWVHLSSGPSCCQQWRLGHHFTWFHPLFLRPMMKQYSFHPSGSGSCSWLHWSFQYWLTELDWTGLGWCARSCSQAIDIIIWSYGNLTYSFEALAWIWVAITSILALIFNIYIDSFALFAASPKYNLAPSSFPFLRAYNKIRMIQLERSILHFWLISYVSFILSWPFWTAWRTVWLTSWAREWHPWCPS